MMKVSFKGDYRDVLVFQDKVTVITLTGRMVMELEHIPHHITAWALQHPSVDVSWTYNNGYECWILKASGKAKCHEDDTPNLKLGEKIAECRAKIRIYRFVNTLTSMLYDYYRSLMCGEDGTMNIIFVGDNSLFANYRKYADLLQHEKHHLVELLQKTV